MIGESISAVFDARYFDETLNVKLEGEVPPGLSISGDRIVGVLTTRGHYQFKITAMDRDDAKSVLLSLKVVDQDGNLGDLINEIVDVMISTNTESVQQYVFDEDERLGAPLYYEVVGSIPSGLKIKEGELLGVFDHSGSFNFTVIVSNESGQIRYGFSYQVHTATVQPTITAVIVNDVRYPTVITKAATHTTQTESELINVIVPIHVPLTVEIEWDRIRGEEYFGLVRGMLPQGLVFDDSTGVISGIPTEVGEFILVVYVKDWRGVGIQWLRLIIQ